MTKNDNHTSQKWYGNIPDRWASHRIKALFNLRDERNYLPLSDVNLISLYTDIGVRQHSDIEHTTGNKARNADGYKIVYQDDIIVNILLCWMGAIGGSDYHGVTSPAYDVYTPKQGINSHYFHYLFRTPLFSQQCYKVGKGIMSMRWRTYSPQFRNIEVPLPPLIEQDRIVLFLGWKVSGINKLINIKKMKIAEARLIRQRKIDLALTHSFDERSSCSEWINRPLKYFVTSNDESLKSPMSDDYEFDYIDISSVGFGFFKKNLEHYTFAEAPSRARRIVKTGDTIISTVRTYLRSMIYINEDLKDCIVSTGFSVLRPKKFVYPQVLNYALSCNYFIDEVIKKSIGVSYPAINDNALLQIKISLPSSIEEQKIIVQQLEQDLTMVDKLIDVLQKEIHLLYEFKTRLISDVVTGQIDVRDIEVPDYDFVDETTDADADSKDEQECDEE